MGTVAFRALIPYCLFKKMMAVVKIKGDSDGVECKWKVERGGLACSILLHQSNHLHLLLLAIHSIALHNAPEYPTTGLYNVLRHCTLLQLAFCNPLIATCPLCW